MKEISFRAYDTFSEAWLNDKISIAMSGDILFEGKPINTKLKGLEDNIRYMQYIGLKDKNGKKVYDGDILEIHSKVAHIKTKGAVHYETKVCAFMLDDVVFKQYIPITQDDEIEVIGNIYQHSELLKVDKNE